jgi:hypothetical protein
LASLFTQLFQVRLRNELKILTDNYTIHPKEKWLNIDNQRVVPVDIFLESVNKSVIIEIESHRQDPSNNIAKILYWFEQVRKRKNIFIFSDIQSFLL